MRRNINLVIDQRIVGIIRAEPDILAAEIARRLILEFSQTYVNQRLRILAAAGVVTLDEQPGRRGINCRLREAEA